MVDVYRDLPYFHGRFKSGVMSVGSSLDACLPLIAPVR